MLFKFSTSNANNALAAQLIYAVYCSRDRGRGPTGVDMWSQIGRFARVSAKHADNIGSFLLEFCRRMGCTNIRPKYITIEAATNTSIIVQTANGNVPCFERNQDNDYIQEIVEGSLDVQKAIIDAIYEHTQNILLLVRDRLGRETEIPYDNQ